MAFTTIPAAGAKLRASVLNGLITEVRPITARKSADETVNNNSTLQNDDDLFVAVEANAVYTFRARFMYTSNSTADFKIAFTYPTGLTMRHTVNCIALATSANVLYDHIESTVLIVEGAGVSTDRSADLQGVITVSSTAGTLQVQFAQNTANASDSKMRAGSFIELTRIA